MKEHKEEIKKMQRSIERIQRKNKITKRQK